MENDITEQKRILRLEMREVRHRVAQERGARWGPAEQEMIFALLRQLNPTYKGPVLSYFPVGSEPCLLPLSDEGAWLFPKVEGDNLTWFPWSASDPLPERSRNGMREMISGRPLGELIGDIDRILCFVPALAADSKGYRLGYGGGFYDRFLSKFASQKNLFTVCVLHGSQLVSRVPRESHDIPVDALLTHTGVLEIFPGRMAEWISTDNERGS